MIPFAVPLSNAGRPSADLFQPISYATGFHVSDFLYIDTAPALGALVSRLRGSEWLALDTEFMREKTYYPQLCLIQIAAPDGTMACVDPLALDSLDPLAGLLFDPAVTKVFHAGRQDLELFYHIYGRVPGPVFDTQLAASLAGFKDQPGYATVVRELLDVHLEKAHTRADWSRRPLPSEVLAYAVDDVRYLGSVYRTLRERLAEHGRLHWLDDEHNLLADPDTYRPNPDTAWLRVKGTQKLKPRQRGALALLAGWREEQAMRRDRPRKWILGDDILLDLARRLPVNRADLEATRGLNPDLARREGDRVLALIEQARQGPGIREQKKGARLTSAQEAMADAVMALIRLVGEGQAISPANLVTRKDLDRLVQGKRDIPLLRGWRRQAAGNEVLALLEGRTALGIEGGKLVILRGD
jgi:ribonuclease D